MKNIGLIFIFANILLGQLQPPQLISPDNQAVNLSANSILFQWSTVDGAEYYRIQIDDDADFLSPVVDETGIDVTEYEGAALFENWHFYWRVSSGRDTANGESEYSEWSVIYEFTTEYTSPVNMLPSDNASGVAYDSVFFSWEMNLAPIVENSLHTYSLQISASENFDSPDFDLLVSNKKSAVVTELQPGIKYWWRVRFGNEFGQGDWSIPTSFDTKLPKPEKVILLSPEKGAENVSPIELEFQWQNVDYADNYILEIAFDSLFNKVYDTQILPSTLYRSTVSVHDTVFFWRVRAENVDQQGEWSEVWNLRLAKTAPFDAPILDVPADSAVILYGYITFKWYAVNYADYYGFQLSDSADFSKVILDTLIYDSTSFTYSFPEQAARYYWRVYGGNTYGFGEKSEVRSFLITTSTLINEKPAQPETYILYQNYPNPFNPTTTISFYLGRPGKVHLIIYDALGKEVARLLDGVFKNEGLNAVEWNGSDSKGRDVASGIYFYVMRIGKIGKTGKMVLIR